MVFTAEQEVFSKFFTKEFRALGIIKGQCGECIQNAVIALVFSVECLNANNRNDDVGWYMVFLLGFTERFLILAPEIDAAFNTLWS